MWQDVYGYFTTFFNKGGIFMVLFDSSSGLTLTQETAAFGPETDSTRYSLLVITTTLFHLTLHKKANLYSHKGQILIFLDLRIRSKYV